MDVFKALRELHEEKKRLDSAIAVLENQTRTVETALNPPMSRRGRRSMSPAEREEVSRRMSRYWASRRSTGPRTSESTGASDGSGPTVQAIQGAA